MVKSLILCAATVLSLFVLALPVDAQRRDYLTEAEIELVRDAQEIDLRVGVLTKAVDRRLAVIRGEKPKEKEDWGPLPTGSRGELLFDIERLLQKAIDDVDMVAQRGRDSKLFPKAVRQFAGACNVYIPVFNKMLETTTETRERGSLMASVTACESVLEALPKVQPDPKSKN